MDSLQIDLSLVDRVVLSHWHRDHSGGILRFLKLRKEATTQDPHVKPVTVDLHPSRPTARGIAPGPTFDKVAVRLPHDPTFQEIQAEGGQVETKDEARAIQGGTVFVSGEIPRITEWETGILGGMRWVHEHEDAPENGKWIPDQVGWWL